MSKCLVFICILVVVEAQVSTRRWTSKMTRRDKQINPYDGNSSSNNWLEELLEKSWNIAQQNRSPYLCARKRVCPWYKTNKTFSSIQYDMTSICGRFIGADRGLNVNRSYSSFFGARRFVKIILMLCTFICKSNVELFKRFRPLLVAFFDSLSK